MTIGGMEKLIREREKTAVESMEMPVKTGAFFEKKISSLDEILTTKDTAEYLRSTPKQIRKWVYQGKIRAYKLCGKSLRFKKSELDLLLEGGRKWA